MAGERTMELNEEDIYSEIILEEEQRHMYVTATRWGLEFYCKEFIEDEVAWYSLSWAEVPAFMAHLQKIVEKWQPKEETGLSKAIHKARGGDAPTPRQGFA